MKMKWERKSYPFRAKCDYKCGDFEISYSEEYRKSGGFVSPACWVLYHKRPSIFKSKSFRTLREAKEAAEKFLSDREKE